MKYKKIPLRSCLITHERLPKGELIRIVKNKDGEVFVDNTGKINGHGAYIKKDISVLDKAMKSKILDKYIDTNIDDNIYLEIRNIIIN
jgi:predicted RNA-binding protein YlxR (DUF448 family)